VTISHSTGLQLNSRFRVRRVGHIQNEQIVRSPDRLLHYSGLSSGLLRGHDPQFADCGVARSSDHERDAIRDIGGIERLVVLVHR
jgi:hypothetical protein